MANEKQINSRIIHKHDIEENWKKATNFIPKQGEIIIYDIDANYNYERFKIGDGITTVNNLLFITSQVDWNQIDNTALDYIKNKPEIATDEEIIEMLMEEDMFPTVSDADGSVLADENNNILLW